jgi:hypothetical protein
MGGTETEAAEADMGLTCIQTRQNREQVSAVMETEEKNVLTFQDHLRTPKPDGRVVMNNRLAAALLGGGTSDFKR